MLEKKEVSFYKMQGSGNDFVVMKKRLLSEIEIIRICDRIYGVGCDQLLMIDDSDPIKVEIFNQDSSKAGNCGNGMRALALLNYIISSKKTSFFQINERIIRTEILEVLRKTQALVEAQLGSFTKKSLGKGITECFVGNKHLVLDREINPDIDLEKLSKDFDANVTSFIYKEGIAEAKIYERGAGETIACGTAAAALHLALNKEEETIVKFEKSKEILRTGMKNNGLYIIGEAQLVYQGNFYLKND
jgi:diaminopimelate epimerase